jgi:hypothetical protein
MNNYLALMQFFKKKNEPVLSAGFSAPKHPCLEGGWAGVHARPKKLLLDSFNQAWF